MSRHLKTCSIAAIAGAAMLTLSIGSASAFTLASPSLENSVASSQVEKVWWRHYGYWGGPRWGWGGGWGYGHRRWCYWHPRACGW